MAGALDEDTAQTLASGRQTVASVLAGAQQSLRRVFLIFVAGWLSTFYALRVFLWDRLQQDLVFAPLISQFVSTTETGSVFQIQSEFVGSPAGQIRVVATDPFQVILLQVKIGIAVGILVAVPAMVYYGRDSLKRRGMWPDARIPMWKKGAGALAIGLLFAGGLSYGYLAFFPVMFEFLAVNAVNAGLQPTWSIVMWTEFVFFLSLSFGLAAQLPLAMSASARAGVVSYETFRDKWRYAVLGIFLFGAVLSPPDPFTQLMWGVPLVMLYFLSLGVTKFAVLSKRASESVSTAEAVRDRWNVVAGASVLSGAIVYAYLFAGGVELVNDGLAWFGSSYRLTPGPELEVLGLPPAGSGLLFVVGTAAVVAATTVFYVRIQALEEQTRDGPAPVSDPAAEPEDADPGESAEIDIAGMSAKAVEAAPPTAFTDLDEDAVLQYAQTAVDNDNPAKGQAILDKFDEAAELDEKADAEDENDEDDGGNIVTSTAAGVLDPFTDGQTTEDDIGGYYYDIRFILDSLTSKAIWLVATFITVLAGSFFLMYRGGLGTAQGFFFQRMPEGLVEEPNVVTLHPVEALIFMLKFSTLLAALSVLPIVLYFAWPAIQDRFGATGNRNVLLVWGGSMFVSLVGGTVLGFLYIAPTLISLLARDVVQANMVVAYRISSFGWLVVLLTVGIGLLAMIPTTMVLFHHGNIVSYDRMRESWRGVVLSVLFAASVLSPSGIFMMFVVAIPASLAYGLGLGLVWLYDRIGRYTPTIRSDPAS